MNFQTLSVVVGNNACNASCPFCVSKKTNKPNGKDVTTYQWYANRLKIASRMCMQSGANTCLITGVGEPTLYPEKIVIVTSAVHEYFPLIELQTNGIRLKDMHDSLCTYLKDKLTTISISAVSPVHEENLKIYGKNYVPLEENIAFLKDMNYSVRISYVGIKGVMDSIEKIKEALDFSKKHNVDQTTYRPVWGDESYAVDTNKIYEDVTFNPEFQQLLILPHGAVVYDYNGMNFCLANCMTRTTDPNNIRQMIVFPDGRIGYDWDRPGAVIL